MPIYIRIKISLRSGIGILLACCGRMFAGGRIGGNSVCESRLQVKGRGFVYRSINEKWESYVSGGGGGVSEVLERDIAVTLPFDNL